MANLQARDSYVVKRAIIKDAFIKSEKSDYEPTEEYLHELFQVDMKSWEYTDSVELDIRNGRPYFVHNVCRNVGAAYGSELFVRPINYDNVREHASKKGFDEDYAKLNENTWRDYVPAEVLKRFDEKMQKKKALAPVIEAVDANSLKDTLFEFYYELHNVHAHHITYLRKTTEGYRVFHVDACGWSYGLPFKFDKTEAMIQDIICNQKYDHDFNAYDRLLSESEAKYIQAKANEEDSKEPAFLSERSSCYQVWKKRKTTGCTKKWEQFASLIEKIAKYGTSESVENKVKKQKDKSFVNEETKGFVKTKKEVAENDDLVFYKAHWAGKAESGEDTIVLKKNGSMCHIVYKMEHVNDYGNPPVVTEKTKNCEVPFNKIFNWYFSETLNFINETFHLSIKKDECIGETEYRSWIIKNTESRKPAYEYHLGNIAGQYNECLEFEGKTKIFLVLESQYYERCHYIAIDKESGQAYEVYTFVVGMTGTSFASITVDDFERPVREITYEELIELAEQWFPGIGILYKGINETNWQEYLKIKSTL